MFDIYQQLKDWSKDPDKLPIYLATVISIEGSAVRGAGATMGIAADGSLTGSVSGGCIESTVIEAAAQLRPAGTSRLMTFCANDDPLMGAPAPCGGTVRVCVYPYSEEVAAAVAARSGRGLDLLWGVCIDGPSEWVGLSFALDDEELLRIDTSPTARMEVVDPADVEARVSPLLPREYGIVEAAAADLQTGEAGPRVFVQHHPPVPHAVVVGGSHIGEALVQQLKALGWRVSLIDPRESFAAPERFRRADRLLHLWPREAFDELGLSAELSAGQAAGQAARHTAVAAITHSEQIDDAAVAAGLDSGCYYVGVLGSTRTFAGRLERLQMMGYSAAQLKRVHGPIGLDIGASSPEEIALAIAAQMVQDYRRGRNAHDSDGSRA